ncbi:hypothetical protein [Pseudorhizobium marinum]|uniref:hypothetical protein n=1 Tax=Pseudorhizobium marinum TaxID=1496690 RepID=UPI00049668F4|nr:hypothetical protein [Pseudorhizobium marinum]
MWIIVMQALLTPIIAAAVAWIAWQQWQTARHKVMLDLFDRRFAVFMDAREIVSHGGQRDRLKDPGLPNDIVARGRFLFGSEILDQLEELHRLCTLVETGDKEAFGRLDPWFKGFIQSLKPYMNFGGMKS